MGQKPGDSILYELLVYSEWVQEPEIFLKLTKPQNKLLKFATHPWMLKELIPRSETVNDKIARLISARLPWQFAVGDEGKVVAIIEDTMLEIRTSRDEYSSIVGKASIARDLFPQYRKAVWSPDCSLLACAFSSGKIGLYDLLGSNILNIEPKVPPNEEWPNASEAVSGVLFLEDRVKSPKWSYELIAIDYKGNLRSFLVSPTEGFREHHTFNFSSYYRNGITTVCLLQPGNLLLLAGPSDVQMDQKGRGGSAGISVWRVLSDHPYYIPAMSSEEDLLSIQGPRGIWGWLPSFRYSQQSDVLAMRVSPKSRYLACIHTSGAISLWHIPSLRLFKHWNLKDQPDHNAVNPQLIQGIQEKTKYQENCIDYLPVDISWWSEQVLIISRYSGAVSVCSISDLQNLLGESPEFFAGQPQISAAYGDGKGFLSLECEVNFTSKKRSGSQFDDSTEEEEIDEEVSSDDLEVNVDASMLAKGAGAVKAALYWVTDSDKFKPPRSNPKIMKRTYRLLGLKSTTPEELYSRKIENEEYGEALQLARAYGLDCDLVYQRQWRNQKVSVATIHDYLSKISKRSWVLKESTERVPETAAAARELLQFGLHATSKRVLFSVASSSEDSMTGFESKLQTLEDGDDPERFDNVDTSDLLQEDLNAEQTEIIRSRQKLLKFMDMLATYELILGKESDILYNPDFYDKFRNQSPLKSALEFARNGNWQAVSIMLTYHSHSLMKHRLPIISNLPETIDPHEYRSLLPECDEEEVVPRITDILRDQDWSETFYFRMEDDEGKLLYDENPSLLEFAKPVLDKDLVTNWYIARATQLEERSKLVDHALSFITLGQARSVTGLEDLYGELSTLETMVYDVQLEKLSLAGLRKYNNLEQAHLLVSKSTSETFISDCRRFLLPHLLRCEKKQPGSKRKLFHDLIVDISRLSLVLPLQVFRHFKSEQTGPLVSSTEEVLALALDCVYSYPGADQLDIAFQYIDCLPEKSYGETNKDVLELHYQVDKLQGHLAAAEILSRHANLSLPISKLRDMGNDEKASFMTLTQMARSLTKRTPTATQAQWSALLTDMLSLQAKVFLCIELEKCFEIYAETMLASGNKANIRYAGSIMECSKSEASDNNQQKIQYDSSVSLILKASREYFDSSESLADLSMDYAKCCLLLITDENDEIKEELDLIASLQILKDFGVSILPIQVRLTSNKLKLLRDCLRAKATSYRSSQRLLQLASFLRICKDDSRAREASVLNLIAEAALNACDYTCCADICQKMMDRCHTSGWEIARKLAECADFHDIAVKRRLLAFALMNCEPVAMQELINQSHKLEMQMLHERIGSKMADGAMNSFTAMSPTNDDFCDALSSPEVERKEFIAIPRIIQQSAAVLKSKTRNVLQNIGNETYWKSAFDWLPQAGNERCSITDRVFTQGFHSFYSDLHGPNCHESSLGYHYDSFSMPLSDPTIDLLISIVRVSILEEITEKDSEDVGLNDDVILKAVKSVLPEDFHLGLCLLASIKDLSQAKELFLQLPRSIVTLQTAAYYFALKVCAEELPPDNFDARVNSSLSNPFQLIHVINQDKLPNCTPTETSSEARKLLSSFIALQGEFLQTLQLQSLDCGVDPLRFSHDEQYRNDSILGLAMTDNPEQLELAQSLAEKYKISASQLAISFLTHLLLDDKGVNQERLMEAVSEQEENLSLGEIEQLENQVLPHISGTDHLRLISYYMVLQKISDANLFYGLPPSQHIKLIKKVRATSPDIDYKILSSDPDGVLTMLAKILSKDNILMVSKLLKILPGSLRCTIQPGQLYRAWMLKLFFQVSKNSTDEQWQGKFNICKEHFSKLSASEFEDVAAELFFSRDAYNHISRECRLEFLSEMLKFSRGRQQIEEWGAVATKLQTWNDHLELFSADKMENLSSAISLEFAKRLEMSRGEEDEVEAVVDDILLSEIPLSGVTTLLSLKILDIPLGSYLTKKLQVARETERWDLVCAILKRLNQLFRDMPDMLVDKSLLRAQIEPLCADTDVDPAVRLQALKLTPRVAQKLSVESDDADGKSCALYTTQAVLATAWPDSQEVTVKSEDLESPQTRNKLFDFLLSEAKSWQQLIALSEVLKAWHSAGLQCNDLWTQLVPQMLDSKDSCQNEIFEILHDIVITKGIPSEGLLELIQPLRGVDQKLQLYLMNEDTILKEQALILFENKETDWEQIVSSDLITMLLERNLVTLVISTPVYPYIIACLLKEEATELIEEVVECLLRAGHKAEAGSLLLQAKRVPAALSTFSMAMGSLGSLFRLKY
ncbi:NBAS subunit of NRZ tethering complex-like [Neocloeon triangulifer]|uniref:NBAS subunit of NRZ tethering complex-like n=1 Tax=Neocloeon triangulifer TaxID=2078957 RepID=UPI00286EDAC5|nr:NBAS subunit of NRZ tethering complex-like [Neocloeon triangulifer]